MNTPQAIRRRFGDNLRALLERGGLSASAFARDLGVNRSQIARYLSHDSYPRPDTLAAICARLECDARIFTEPLDEIQGGPSRRLVARLGKAVRTDDTESDLPIGMWRFWLRSFGRPNAYFSNLVKIDFSDGAALARVGMVNLYQTSETASRLSMSGQRQFYHVCRSGAGYALYASGNRTTMFSTFCYVERVYYHYSDAMSGYCVLGRPRSPSLPRFTPVVFTAVPQDLRSMLALRREVGYHAKSDLPEFVADTLSAIEDPRPDYLPIVE